MWGKKFQNILTMGRFGSTPFSSKCCSSQRILVITFRYILLGHPVVMVFIGRERLKISWYQHHQLWWLASVDRSSIELHHCLFADILLIFELKRPLFLVLICNQMFSMFSQYSRNYDTRFKTEVQKLLTNTISFDVEMKILLEKQELNCLILTISMKSEIDRRIF